MHFVYLHAFFFFFLILAEIFSLAEWEADFLVKICWTFRPLEVHKSMGLAGIHLRVLREMDKVLPFHYLPPVLVNQGDPN